MTCPDDPLEEPNPPSNTVGESTAWPAAHPAMNARHKPTLNGRRRMRAPERPRTPSRATARHVQTTGPAAGWQSAWSFVPRGPLDQATRARRPSTAVRAPSPPAPRRFQVRVLSRDWSGNMRCWAWGDECKTLVGRSRFRRALRGVRRPCDSPALRHDRRIRRCRHLGRGHPGKRRWPLRRSATTATVHAGGRFQRCCSVRARPASRRRRCGLRGSTRASLRRGTERRMPRPSLAWRPRHRRAYDRVRIRHGRSRRVA
jgi:hypothetical protein